MKAPLKFEAVKGGVPVKRSILASALVFAAVVSSTASGAFFIDDGKVVSTERGDMGKFQPYDAQGKATFEVPNGNMEPKQAKYQDAELLVDLAYTPVSQRGSGEPGLVNGFGDDLPFVDAMTMIMPTGWHLYRDHSLDKGAVPEKLSFSGGRTWPDVLKQVGDRYALHFHIDWFDKTIMMGKGRTSMVSVANHTKVIPEPAKAAPIAVAVPVGAAASAVPFAVGGPATPINASKPVGTPSSVQQSGGFKVTTSGASTVTTSALPASSAPPMVTATAMPAVITPVVAVAPPRPVAPPIPTWNVSQKDHTIRQALKSWANVAGWTFEPEHWAVPVDIPITASAPFSGDFKTAVRQLIGTTELSATPLQPCFYSNRVVRVVPINEMCDRMSAR